MAVDPTQLAEDQEASQRITAAGAPTEFAKGPEQEGVQLAGLFNVLNRLGPARRPVGPADADAALPPGVSPETVTQPQRVPTPQEMPVVPSPGEYSERRTQEILAPQVLSPEGAAEFERRGFKAQADQQVETIEGAEAALAAQEADAAVLAQDVKDQARAALSAEVRGFKPETGVADEKLSNAMIDRMKLRDGEIKSLEDGGDFNFNYMETTDDVKSTITSLAEVYKDQQAAVTRGYISNDVTADKAATVIADEVGLTRRLLKRKIGDGSLNAETMLAARELLVRSGEKLTSLALKIKGGTANAADRLAFRRQLAIHAGIQLQVKGAQTEAARTLQSFQIKVGGELSAVEQAREAQRLLQESGGADVVDAMADNLLRVQNENGQRGINSFARGGWRAKTRQMVSEAYLAGLLSNPATQVKNIVGTASFMAYQLPAEMIAGMYGATVRGGRSALKLPIRDDQVYMDDAAIRFKGWMDSYKDAMKAASIAWRSELPASEASKLDVEQYSSIAGESSGWTSQAISQFGKRVRIPFRLLLSTDEFFKTISQRGELYVQANSAYKKALRDGKTVTEAEDEAGMILLDPRSVSEQLDTKAKLDTLQSDLGNFGKFTGMAQRFDVAGIPVGRMILPFATAPTNSFLRSAEFMGISPKTWADLSGKNGAKAQQMATGRLAVGGATMAVVADYATQGSITGGMPSDAKVRDALPPGWQPYSFVFKGEGFPEDKPLYDVYGRPNGPLEYVSYAGYEPVGAIIALTADTVQRMHKTRDPEVRGNLAAAAAGSVIDYYKELPMLQGLSDVVFALEYNDPMRFFRSPSEAATPIGIGPLSIPSPVSSLQRAGGRIVDPTVLRPRADVEYYTEQDILAKNEDGTFVFAKSDGTPDYGMIGLPKNDFGSAISKIRSNLSAYQSKDSFFRDEYDRNAPVYDTMGNVIGENDVSLASNPGLAIFNNLSGLRIRKGEEITDTQAELMRLASMTGGWPLTNPTSMGGVRLAFGAQSDLVNIAKNEVTVRQGRLGKLTFNEALTAMTTTTNNTLGRQYDRASDLDRKGLVQSLNRQYLEAGFQVLLEMPRYANLAQAFYDMKRAKDKGLR